MTMSVTVDAHAGKENKMLTSKTNQEIKRKIQQASQLMFERNKKAYKDLENR